MEMNPNPNPNTEMLRMAQLQVSQLDADHPPVWGLELMLKAPVGICVFGEADRKFKFMNEYAVDLFGHCIEFAQGAVNGESESIRYYDLSQLFANVQVKDNACQDIEVSIVVCHDDGTTEKKYLNFKCQILNESAGHDREIVLVAIDVTEQVKARMRAEESQDKYKSLTNAIPDMMWTADVNGIINFANDRCLQYTGVHWDYEHNPEAWAQSIHPDDLEGLIQDWLESMKGGSPFRREYRIRDIHGRYRWFLGRAMPTQNSQGEVLYWTGTATDIDESKKISEELVIAKEQAEMANASKSAFLANMSHEIRTPLAAILGYSGLLKETELAPQERDQFIDTINRNGHALTKIIDDILDLAKVEAGQLEVESIEFSFHQLMQELEQLFKENAKQKGILLTLKIAESTPERIFSDPTRLRQILINIIGNAIKFTISGGVHISCGAERCGGRQYLINIDVKDTGCGLSKAQSQRLFKPFSQADNSMARQYGGTGLGLALSQKLAMALGGDVTLLDSNPRVGSTFRISISAVEVKKNPPPEDSERSSLQNEDADPALGVLKNCRVLLVDDASENRYLVKRILCNYGAEVNTASSGSEAIALANSMDFDIVLMDIQMPNMDGYQTLATLRSTGYSVPIVALTAHAMLEDRLRTQAAGFVGHLAKPIDTKVMLAEITRHMVSRR